MTATPSGTGGSPTAVHSSSPHASTCGRVEVRPGGVRPAGVHDARISSWAAALSSAMPPKLSVATRVTVPDAVVYAAPWASSASVSQLQPTAASIGSVISSGSISARA